ncbi:MAG: polysaccharide biosynthesis protein [Prevotella sp.]|nr:polysaccharide biosynthesis protein [Prevotella sp.]
MNAISKIINWYFSKNALPYWCLFLLDCAIVVVSGLMTFWVFNRTVMLFMERFDVLFTVLAFAVLSAISARVFRTYSGIVRYSSFVDLLNVAYANGLSMIMALAMTWTAEWFRVPQLSALNQTQTVITFVVATLAMWGVRVLVKTLYDMAATDKHAQKVLIYGAMSGGVGLAKNIRSQKPKRFVLAGFISHDPRAKHLLLMGKPVYNVSDDLVDIIKKEGITAVLVSPMRTREFRNNQAVQDMLISAGCKIYMAQHAKEAKIEDGQLTEEQIEGMQMQMQEVQVEDLLPRDEITVDMESVGKELTGKRVLITGSAGSIGSEIVRQVALYRPAQMILIDQAETPQHDIRLMMAKEFPYVKAETIVTSIDRKTRMDTVFSMYRPDYVFHAAAYKHVPMMEDNPSEAILNNVYGTKVIADMAVKYGVKKFVMISTDKAVNPTNVMGCSKRICEIYVQALDKKVETQFVTTRFGNVLGSNGSVIPLFREQIKNGGPLTVTHPDIIRFFMLIPEACKLVLEAGTKGHGGEIFVFDMGKPVKIADLAQRMINLSGAKNVEIKFTGLRPGEKLYEEVLNELEGTKPTFHEKIRIATVREYDYDEVSKEIDDLIDIAKKYDKMETVKKMKEIVPEYVSKNSEYEVLDKIKN